MFSPLNPIQLSFRKTASIRHLLLLMLLLQPLSLMADKPGLYLGAGISLSTYRVVSTQLDISFEGETTTGWRAEAGYIWDTGKPGGFHLGIAGIYDDLGSISLEDDSFTISSGVFNYHTKLISVVFVMEQEIAYWVDFIFKVGPAYGYYDSRESGLWLSGDPFDYRESGGGLGHSIHCGFIFFPTPKFAIELSGQGAYFIADGDLYDAHGAASLVATLQYRL